ncbi:MAG: NUDIX hydrolase [Lachnospiraceae bacterium]|nr:NUDIX hydrolase [Lachnospiraceae bacterium]
MKLLRFDKVRDGKYLKTYELTYLNKSDREKKFEIVSYNDLSSVEELGQNMNGLSIVAFHEGKMLLLREFRMGVNRYIYNLCAGRKEADETVQQCIDRELYEETGLKVKKIIKILPPSFAAVAMSDVRTQIVFCQVEGNFSDHTSENEDIKTRFYSKEECARLLETEEFSSRCQAIVYFYSCGMLDEIANG